MSSGGSGLVRRKASLSSTCRPGSRRGSLPRHMCEIKGGLGRDQFGFIFGGLGGGGMEGGVAIIVTCSLGTWSLV